MELVNKQVANLSLHFKPKSVRNFERKHGPITDSLEPNIEKLTLLVQAGNGGCDEDTADNILESFLDSGGDIVEGIVQVVEALQRGGFLPRNLEVARVIRKNIKEQIEKIGENLDQKEKEEKKEKKSEIVEV